MAVQSNVTTRLSARMFSFDHIWSWSGLSPLPLPLPNLYLESEQFGAVGSGHLP